MKTKIKARIKAIETRLKELKNSKSEDALSIAHDLKVELRALKKLLTD